MAQAIAERRHLALAVEHRLKIAGHALAVVGVEEIEARLAHQVFGGEVQRLRHRRTDEGHAALLVEDGDDVGRFVDERPEAFLAQRQGILGAAALVDLAGQVGGALADFFLNQ